MTFDEYKKERVGKRVRETEKLGYQCVAQVKHFAKLVHWQNIGTFWGTALNGRKTGKPFVGKPYVRVTHTGKEIPPRWAIVFFDATEANKSGHVAVAGSCDKESLWVIEQNAGKWSGTGLWEDAIRVHQYTYNPTVGKLLWRFIHYHTY